MQIGSIYHDRKRYRIMFDQNTQIASLQPLPSNSVLNKYYEDYHQRLDDRENININTGRLNTITKFKSGGRLLDIGAGRGYFLNTVNQKPSWQGTGIEISPTACQYANKHYHLKIQCSTLSTAKFPDNYFDVITFYAILEHLRYPLRNLKVAYRKLKKDGLLVIRVPNIRSFEYFLCRLFKRKYNGFIFVHLHYFTPKGIQSLLKKAGFRVIKITSQHFSPVEKIRKNPYWLVANLGKRFLEKTAIGGKLCFGNILLVYARKE